MPGRSFAPSERFVTEVANRKLKPAYVFIGDEALFRQLCAGKSAKLCLGRKAGGREKAGDFQ